MRFRRFAACGGQAAILSQIPLYNQQVSISGCRQFLQPIKKLSATSEVKRLNVEERAKIKSD